MIFVIQNCAPRDWRPLWLELCRQIDETWPNDGDRRPDVIVHQDEGSDGQLLTMLRALGRGLICGERWAWPVTLLEDDIEVCDGFVSYVVERWRGASSSVVRWYAPGGWEPPVQNGIWVHEEGAEYGFNQATTFAPEFVRRLKSSPLVPTFMQRGRHGGDDLIAAVLDREREHFATHVPGLVQHLGAASLVEATHGNTLRAGRRLEGRGLHSDLYIGRDFDPRAVLR